MRDDDRPLDMGNYPEIAADDVLIDHQGPLSHLLFTSRRKIDGRNATVIVCRVTVPTEAVQTIAYKMLAPAWVESSKRDEDDRIVTLN
jgi:hypothetical protein